MLENVDEKEILVESRVLSEQYMFFQCFPIKKRIDLLALECLEFHPCKKKIRISIIGERGHLKNPIT